ncbi:MAG: glycosyltransferase family 2 protein [Maioricimonas sp. JB049]
MTLPRISVVMGVYNARKTVRAAVDSLLGQTFEDFELIIVDDGSNDGTSEILAKAAKEDRRIRIIRQTNAGLTRALSRGCDAATGMYLARQDADDVSFADRFRLQVAALESEPSAVLATCWVEDRTSDGVLLDVWREREHTVRLDCGEVRSTFGIAAHGSVLMRRDVLQAVGGYRNCFYYAQDSDLWLRMAEAGSLCVVPEVLYRRISGLNCISSRYGSLQSRFYRLAEECFRARQAGRDETPLLEQARQLSEHSHARRNEPVSRRDRATSLKLLASRLSDRDATGANRYLLAALKTDPLNLRSWYALCKNNARSVGRRLRPNRHGAADVGSQVSKEGAPA